MSIFKAKATLNSIGGGGLILLAGALFLIFFARLPAQFSDWHYFFRPATQAWLAGNSPYQIDGFVNPPWLIFLLLPLSLLTEQYGLATLALFTIIALILTIRSYQGGRLLLLGGLITPSVFSLLLLGQVDALVLCGILIGQQAIKSKKWWGLGLALALVLVKPQIGGGVTVLWLWKTPYRLKLPAFALLGGIWAASSLAVGVWWPLGIAVTSIERSPVMDISTLAAVRGLGLPLIVYLILVVLLAGLWVRRVFKEPPNRYTTALSVLTAALAAPYVARHSLAVAMATAFIWVGRRSRLWGVPLYVLTWMMLLGRWIRPWFGWWETVAWWGLLVGMLVLQDEQRTINN